MFFTRMWLEDKGYLDPGGMLTKDIPDYAEGLRYFEEVAIRDLRSIYFFVLCILAIVWVFISLSWDVKAGESDWFSPSGAVLVLAAVFSEMYSRDRRDWTFPRFSRIRSLWMPIILKFNVICGYVLATTGTVIWAYGDMIFRYIQRVCS